MSLAEILVAIAVVLLAGAFGYRRLGASARGAAVRDRRHLVPGIDVGGQVGPVDVAELKLAGYRTLVNMRPDGEDSVQPLSASMATVAADEGLNYAYIPTSAASMPDSAIDDLGRSLAHAEAPVLIYCRSGTRVARAWALAEASRPGGLNRQGIVDAVQHAGFEVDKLLPRIDARLAARSTQTPP